MIMKVILTNVSCKKEQEESERERERKEERASEIDGRLSASKAEGARICDPSVLPAQSRVRKDARGMLGPRTTRIRIPTAVPRAQGLPRRWEAVRGTL